MRFTQRLAAGLIRAHLWQPTKPPSTDDRPWTMGRELSIWATLARGTDPEALNGAIEHMRDVADVTGPMSLRWFLSNRALLARCVAAWHDSLPPCLGGSRDGGVSRLVVAPPSPNRSEAL